MNIYDVTYTTEKGPHKGWMSYQFTMYDHEWRLLTIANEEEPHSYISLMDNGHVRRHHMPPPWGHFSFSKFHGILEPLAAMLMIVSMVRMYEKGVVDGKNAKIDEFNEVLKRERHK